MLKMKGEIFKQSSSFPCINISLQIVSIHSLVVIHSGVITFGIPIILMTSSSTVQPKQLEVFSFSPLPLSAFKKYDSGFKCLKPDSRTSSLVLNLSCLNQTSSLLTLTDLQLLPPLRSESGCHP